MNPKPYFDVHYADDPINMLLRSPSEAVMDGKNPIRVLRRGDEYDVILTLSGAHPDEASARADAAAYRRDLSAALARNVLDPSNELTQVAELVTALLRRRGTPMTLRAIYRAVRARGWNWSWLEGGLAVAISAGYVTVEPGDDGRTVYAATGRLPRHLPRPPR